MQVDQIRVKVWNGERLSDEELELLRKAAAKEAGPVLRTTVAQALINADHSNEALSILESIRRDYPRELQVQLALGRALIGLEKWSDAERPLKLALEINPGDPEPMKALATIALRRSEFARARALLDDVLRGDPIDAEAQMLLAEIDQLEPPKIKQAPSIDDFKTALIDCLKQQSTPHLLQKDHLVIRLRRGAVARFQLDALFSEATSENSVADGARLVARDLAERSLGLPPGRVHLLSRVLPLIRDSQFLDRGVGSLRREGPAGLWVFYAIEDPEVVLYVPEGLLPSYRATHDQIDTAAWKNLEGRSTPIRAIELEGGGLKLSSRPTGLWALAQGDGHDAARLLTAAHQEAIAQQLGSGPLRVYLGLRELVLFCLEDEKRAVQKLSALDCGRDGICGAWRLENRQLSVA